MAKQLVSPVEAHLEKAVVAIAGAALIYVIAQYLVTSPNRIEVASDQVQPSQIDAKVREQAVLTAQRVRQAKPLDIEFEPLADDFERELDAFAVSQLALEVATSAPFGPEVPIVDKAIPRAGENELVEVVQMGKPVVAFGRGMVERADARGDQGFLRPLDWVTVSANFDVNEQASLQRNRYGLKFENVVFGEVQIQRRARRHDGAWSDEDWRDIQPSPSGAVPKIPDIQLETEDGRLVLPKVDRTRLGRFFEDLREPRTQLDLIRPMMLTIEIGDEWSFPVVSSYRDVLLQDHEYLFPREPLTDEPENRYREEIRKETELVDETETTKEILVRVGELLKQAGAPNCSRDAAVDAYNLAQGVKVDKDASRSEQSRAERYMNTANQKTADIDRGICRRSERNTSPKEVAGQTKSPIQQLWAHDAGGDSVVDGKTYQYRMRTQIYNRLAGEPAKFRKAEDALEIFLVGPWSQPSDPVTIPPDIFVFATRSDERKDTVAVDVFKWFEGVWVKDRWTAQTGDKLFNRSRQFVPPREPDGDVEQPLITFDPNLTIIDMDHRRLYRERKRVRGGGTTFSQTPAPHCAVVFRDAEGRLQERFVPFDKNDPQKSAMANRVFKKPRSK